MMKRMFLALALAVGLTACTEPLPKDQSARILTMGDSMMAWNSGQGASVSHAVEDLLREPVVDRSVIGARVFYSLPVSGALGMNIAKQYRPSSWDWVILNGGGNDLWLGCGCQKCERKMARMLSTDGRSGAVADMVGRIRRNGARVVYVGYLRSPGRGSLIDHCRDEGDAFEVRLARMAALDDGIYFLSLKDLVPHGDASFHVTDRIHPSSKASRRIAQRIADIIDTAP